MNFLAHLWFAGDDDGHRLGAMLGDFIRGKRILLDFPDDVRIGIQMHRHIDQYLDTIREFKDLREAFPPRFRRYSGIVIDLAYDHELALRWREYSDITLEDFDLGVRALLAENDAFVPDGLRRFMAYADRRGLFATYRSEPEILCSLKGIGRRLSRPNPLHRVNEIWDELKPRFSDSFEGVFRQVQFEVSDWLKRKSTTTGS
jgi:acyl carrier protein phosphodiesterase